MSEDTEVITNIDGMKFSIHVAPKSVLHVSPYLSIEHESSMPNRWHRFWQRVLLGWTWSVK